MKERLTYLFYRYLKNNSSGEELEEFLGYVKNAKNDQALRSLIREVFDNIRGADASLASYIDENGNLVLKEREEQFQQEASREERVSGRKRKVAVVFLPVLAVLAGFIWYSSHRLQAGRDIDKQALVHSSTKKITEHSEYKFMVLPDSTQVWLNDNSSFEYPDRFDGKIREVYLSGEAFFDVKHAEEIPFIIHTGKITTTVLGTAFNIKAYPYQHSVLVSVSRGTVKVSKDNHVVALLVKGQQAKVSSVDSIVKEKKVDTGETAYWQQGYLTYDDETIGEIVEDLNHIYNVSINVSDTALEQLRITTSFKRDIGADQALKIICKLIDGRIINIKGQYYIQSL